MAVALSVTALYAESQPDTLAIYSIGLSPVRAERPEKAREEAVKDAFNQAVHVAILGILSPEEIARQFSEITETIYSKTGNYIENFKVLTEYKSESEYRVFVQSSVSIKLLKKVLQIQKQTTKSDKPLPQILLFISERLINSSEPLFWWKKNIPQFDGHAEKAVSAAFTEKGFQVMDHGFGLAGIDLEADVPQNPDIQISDAAKMAKKLKADVFLIGKSAAYKTLNSMNEETKTYSGVLTAKAYLTDTGQEIGFSMQTEISVESSEIEGMKKSITLAGKKGGQELASQIQSNWNRKESGNTKIELIIGGNAYLRNFILFRKKLEEVPGVKNVSLTQMKSDEANLSVEYPGNAQEFAKHLMTVTFDNFGLNIYEATAQQLRIELVLKE